MTKQLDWDLLYQQTVMIVDDSRPFRQLVTALLGHVGFKNVRSVSSCDEAIRQYKVETIDLTFLDIDMPETNGIETLEKLKAICPSAYIVMLTGHDTGPQVEAAKQHGARAFITKPFNADKINTILEDYARQRNIFKR